MRSAFGVEHGDEVSKLGLAPVKGLLKTAKGGYKNPDMSLPGSVKGAKVWNAAANVGRNKKAYGAGTAAGGAGIAGGYYAGSNNRKY